MIRIFKTCYSQYSKICSFPQVGHDEDKTFSNQIWQVFKDFFSPFNHQILNEEVFEPDLKRDCSSEEIWRGFKIEPLEMLCFFLCDVWNITQHSRTKHECIATRSCLLFLFIGYNDRRSYTSLSSLQMVASLIYSKLIYLITKDSVLARSHI